MKNKWSKIPKKGTKAREFAHLLFSKRGATAKQYNGTMNGAYSAIEYLRDDCGYDIRIVGRVASSRPLSIYRVVGRVKWDGSYKDFISKDEIPDFNLAVDDKQESVI